MGELRIGVIGQDRLREFERGTLSVEVVVD